MSDLAGEGQRSRNSQPLQIEQLDLAIALRQEQITILDQLIVTNTGDQAELLKKRYYVGIDLQKLLRRRSLNQQVDGEYQ